jgi:hypothetical protein
VTVTFDPVKRLVTLQERGLDFATDAEKLFAGAMKQLLSTIASTTVRFGG